jgi:hypothetical protein
MKRMEAKASTTAHSWRSVLLQSPPIWSEYPFFFSNIGLMRLLRMAISTFNGQTFLLQT